MAERADLKRLPVLITGTCSCGCECCSVPDEAQRGIGAEGLRLPMFHTMGCTCGCTCCGKPEEIPEQA